MVLGEARVELQHHTSHPDCMDTYLTYSVMKATRRQALAVFQPSLSIHNFREQGSEDKFVIIRNLGTQPIVFLDATIKLYPSREYPGGLERKVIVHRCEWLDDKVLYGSGEGEKINYSLTEALRAAHVAPHECGCKISLTVSDLSQQVVAVYDYFPVTGAIYCRLKYPIGVKLRRFAQPWGWRYHRVKG